VLDGPLYASLMAERCEWEEVVESVHGGWTSSGRYSAKLCGAIEASIYVNALYICRGWISSSVKQLGVATSMICGVYEAMLCKGRMLLFPRIPWLPREAVMLFVGKRRSS